MPSDQFRRPTSEAGDYADAITTAIEAVSKMHVAAGKRPMFMDPISALLGVLGSFVAGSPPDVRPDVLAKVHRLIDIAVAQSLAEDTGQHVQISTKGPLQ